MKWTKAYRKSSGKEMVLDKTFDFEKRRNRPVRYDRELYVRTVQAMRTIDRVKEVRKLRYYKKRMTKRLAIHKNMAEKELLKNATLLEKVVVPERIRDVEMESENIEHQDAMLNVVRNKRKETN